MKNQCRRDHRNHFAFVFAFVVSDAGSVLDAGTGLGDAGTGLGDAGSDTGDIGVKIRNHT